MPLSSSSSLPAHFADLKLSQCPGQGHTKSTVWKTRKEETHDEEETHSTLKTIWRNQPSKMT
jgi:hypothetical protein